MSSYYWGNIGSGGSSSITVNNGISEINFGSTPGSNYAYVNVTGQIGISTTSSIKVWISALTTSDHNDFEHLMLNMKSGISYGNIINDVGFTIYILTELRVTGTFKINWEWI